MTKPQNYYQILQVPGNADSKTLRKAFYALSKTYHPDTTSLPPEEASRKFQQVCEAYDLLSDNSLRATYDLTLDAKASSLLSSGNQPFSNVYRGSYAKVKDLEVRRPLSGGELFSLLLLGLALLISLLLGIGFALAQGRDLQVRPTWMTLDSRPFQDVLLQPQQKTSACSPRKIHL